MVSRKVVALLCLVGFSTSAFAKNHCQYYPVEQRMGIVKIAQLAEKEGIDIVKAEEDDGCYEVEGFKKGSNVYVENKYDMKTGKLIWTEEKYNKRRR